jgi:hypothetical protein
MSRSRHAERRRCARRPMVAGRIVGATGSPNRCLPGLVCVRRYARLTSQCGDAHGGGGSTSADRGRPDVAGRGLSPIDKADRPAAAASPLAAYLARVDRGASRGLRRPTDDKSPTRQPLPAQDRRNHVGMLGTTPIRVQRSGIRSVSTSASLCAECARSRRGRRCSGCGVRLEVTVLSLTGPFSARVRDPLPVLG